MTRILRELGGAVARLTLDGPDQRNILDEEFWTEFSDALDELENERSTRVVVLAARGAAFSAGGDLVRMRQSIEAMASGEFEASEIARMDRNSQLLLRWAGLRAVRIAAVQGPAVGAGLGLAASCDVRVLAATAFLDTGFSRIGLTGDVGVTYYLRRILGHSQTTAWLLRSRRVNAEEALTVGLAQAVVPLEGLPDAVEGCASAYATGSRVAADWVLERETEVAELAPVLDRERDATIAAKQTPFHKAAVEQFVARSA